MSTPLLEQYHAIKREHAGDILLFRLGDFYEMFYDDAKTASRILGITLTGRMKGENRIPMAGIPHHASTGYINRLLRAGQRVAVCEQKGDPEEAEGIVEREVVRVITPGTLIDEGLLDAKTNNFLAAAAFAGDRAGLAWVDLSTGEFLYDETAAGPAFWDAVARIAPAECLVAEERTQADAPFVDRLRQATGAVITPWPGWHFDPEQAGRVLREHFGTANLAGFGIADAPLPAAAAGSVVAYLRQTQKVPLRHVASLRRRSREGILALDRATQLALELVQPLHGDDRSRTLLGVLDQSRTAMGGRLLRQWILAPLADAAAIRRRQEGVRALVEREGERKSLREALGPVCDLERLVARVGSGRAAPRDLAALRDTLALLPDLRRRAAALSAAAVRDVGERIDLLPDLRTALAGALVDEPPALLTDGGIFRPGFHAELDDLRAVARSGKDWIARFQADEIARTGIGSLKVGFNQVFGYYIEVTNVHREKIPAEYVRKQTMKNAERYITPALKEQETKVLHADERARKLEYDLFGGLRESVAARIPELQRTAAALAELDVLAGLAHAAVEHRYAEPAVDDGDAIVVREGRHPVVERALPGAFVPNDLRLDREGRRVLLITGPNMAGKSTYLRQTAIIVLMAQIGSFVPAAEARIGVVDRIFTRVGAADDLARGASTFMVEMNETAAILHHATPRSLVILDEIGRGTSTFDGLAIAWAVTEHLHDRVGARTLFATHYHELTELAAVLPGVKNLHVAAREWGDGIVFLHQILEGPTDRSYGIHVARLAGIPKPVLERAKTILARLEDEALDSADRPKLADRAMKKGDPLQLSLFGGGSTEEQKPEADGRRQTAGGRRQETEPGIRNAPAAPDPVRESLKKIDVNALTPLQAMQTLAELAEKAKGGAAADAQRPKRKPG